MEDPGIMDISGHLQLVQAYIMSGHFGQDGHPPLGVSECPDVRPCPVTSKIAPDVDGFCSFIDALYPLLTRGEQAAADRAKAAVRLTATAKRTKAQSKIEELRQLISPNVSINATATRIEQAVDAYKGNRWSLSVEKKRTPIGAVDRVLHELVLSLRGGELPANSTLRGWLS
jgi:hypothetical protein